MSIKVEETHYHPKQGSTFLARNITTKSLVLVNPGATCIDLKTGHLLTDPYSPNVYEPLSPGKAVLLTQE